MLYPALPFRLGHIVKKGLPTLVALVFVFATTLPVYLAVFPTFGLSLPLIPIYFWSIHRPGAIPAIVAFLIGLLHDLIGGHPLGLNALILVSAQWATFGPQGRFLAQSLLTAWYGFFLIASLAAILHWLAGWLIFSYPSPFPRIAGSYLITVFLYPVIAYILALVGRLFEPTREI